MNKLKLTKKKASFNVWPPNTSQCKDCFSGACMQDCTEMIPASEVCLMHVYLVRTASNHLSSIVNFLCSLYSNHQRGQGSGNWEKKGQWRETGDGRCTGGRVRGGQEVRFPRWQEVGEKGENYAKLCNIWQSKKCKGGGANKNRELGLKGVGIRKSKPPVLSPPPHTPPSGQGVYSRREKRGWEVGFSTCWEAEEIG